MNSLPEEIGLRIISAGSKTKQKELLKNLANENDNVFVQRDLDDKTTDIIRKSIADSFKNELLRNGFSIEKDSPDEIILENSKLTQIKSFNPFNILITGNSADLPDIQNHAIEDYLLLILKKQPELVKEILGESKTLPEFNTKNGKDVLENIFGSFDDSIC